MNHKIFCQDCVSFMENRSDSSIDLILTSPPYNSKTKDRKDDPYNKRYDVYDDVKNDDEYLEWMVKCFNLFEKILKKNKVVLLNFGYGSKNAALPYLLVSQIQEKTKFTIVDTIVWKKQKCLPNNVSHNKLSRYFEFIFVFCRKDEIKTFECNKKVKSVSKYGQKFYENVKNVIEAPNNDCCNNLNKATFSTNLVLQLLQIYATPQKDYIVYDPFMGIGTTAKGCIQYGVDYIGTEISQDQVDHFYKTK